MQRIAARCRKCGNTFKIEDLELDHGNKSFDYLLDKTYKDLNLKKPRS